jgi:GNAT superfamily N-acetyltransferase
VDGAGAELVVRAAGADDLPKARELHRRCSARTLGLRYRGPVEEADGYLGHLLDPRHGRAVVAETPCGDLIGLGHLLWDGDEAEIALLVADAWQRRGVGAALLRRLLGWAAETGRGEVYAVTEASNAGMIGVLRGTGLPFDCQPEEGALVVSLRLGGRPLGVDAPALPGGRLL